MSSKEQKPNFPVTLNDIGDFNKFQARVLGFGNESKVCPKKEELNIIKNEKEAWKNVFGVDIEVLPLPDFVTPEVQKNLEKMGMELRFIPNLNLDDVNKLQKLGVEKYLEELHNRYPNWNPYEKLSESQKEDHSVMRNLEEWFWNNVKDKKIDFPKLSGKWIAVETIPKPKYGDKYKSSIISDMLGFDNRFGTTWNQVNIAINQHEAKILTKIGIKQGKIRMLDALEYNLLANREAWGATDTYEWTNTEYRAYGDSRRVIVGHSDDGGAALADWGHSVRSGGDIGWRVVVDF